MGLHDYISGWISGGLSEADLVSLLSTGLMISGPVVALISLLFQAPYGRHTRSGFGPKVPAAIAWCIQEAPSFIVFAYVFFAKGTEAHQRSLANLTLASMFLFHYFYRSFVYPFFLRGRPTPLLPAVLAFTFCTLNGWLQATQLARLGPVLPVQVMYEPRFVIGAAAWLAGWLINFHSDHVLRNLRKPGETGYRIPRGGFFEYVSAANYFGESLEWSGWALACGSFPAAAFAVFTVTFLGSRARGHHKWYQSKFEDYPRSRKAFIPFIW
jgi:3-oxo-5-alpha-steroid 4-dehydrogenase 1